VTVTVTSALTKSKELEVHKAVTHNCNQSFGMSAAILCIRSTTSSMSTARIWMFPKASSPKRAGHRDGNRQLSDGYAVAHVENHLNAESTPTVDAPPITENRPQRNERIERTSDGRLTKYDGKATR